MSDTARSSEDRFSTKAFMLGLCVVFGLYLLLFGVLAALQSSTMHMLGERLASQSVLIERIQTGVVVAAAPGVEHHDQAAEISLETEAHLDPADTTTPEDQHKSPEAVADTHKSAAEELAELVSPASKSLPSAPVDGVFEEAPEGLLPACGPGKLTPFLAYRKPFTLNRDKPAIAVAVLDYGLSAPISEEILKELPASVSLILTPYSMDAVHWQELAREDGHEIWMQMMIQNEDFPRSDPGAKGLMTHVSLKYNQDRYLWTLARTTGYAGIAAFTDRSLESARPMFEHIAEDIVKRGLGYFELSTSRYSFFEPLVLDGGRPATHAHLQIKDVSPGSKELAEVDRMIGENGGAIVTLKPTPANIKALKAWIASVQERGIELVPVSAIAGLSTE